ncbi:MAG TPA: hypothetical protein VE871_02065, partial [Longimicrobium sp.]|nr:hypothetical protein [Longimicrobium sp.]
MLFLQAAADAAHGAPAAAAQAGHAAEAASHGAAFHPVLPWLIIALPLLGFVINGLAALIAARRALPHVPPVGDPHWDTHGHDHAPQQVTYALAGAGHGHDAHTPSEQEGMDTGTRPNPADHAHGHDAHDDHGHAHGPKPWTHTLPSLVAPGVILGAFVVAVANWLAMRGAGEFEVIRGWSWMYADDLKVDFSLLLDPLSMVMTLIITGVGFLIHLFSIGYMKEDPGYPRYMAYLNLFV